MTSNYQLLPAEIAAPEAARPRMLLLATAFVSLATTMGFASLIGLYVATRADVIRTGETWLPRGVTIPLTQPNMMMFTMVFSAATLAWAIQAMRNDDRANFYIASAVTLLLGFGFVSQSAYLLTIMELDIRSIDRAPLFFAVIGTHMAITVAAMAYLAGMTLRALGGNYNARDLEGIYGATMFWYTTVGLYLVVWFAVYITK